MATVLAVYNSEGCVGRCDAKCHRAKGDKCTCVCGGVNHGVGDEKAAELAAEMGQQILEAYQEKGSAHAQLPLPLTTREEPA